MRTNKITPKPTKKINNRNAQLVKRLAKKYGVSETFVYQSLSGTRLSPTSESIKSDYKKNQSKIEGILDSVFKITGIA